MSDLIGRSLGHFRVVEKIGEGGMGVVYLAMDDRLRRTVALKVLRPEVADDERRRGRFLREARFAAALAHPNVCAVHEVGESEGLVYMAMELLEGSSLRVRLSRGSRGRLPPAQALTIARDIARALARAHEKGIIHRDLKPDNVIVYEPNPGVLAAKVLDFGLAKALDAEREKKSPEHENTATFVTAHGVAIGTPGYMAPEQAKGLEVDARADIYSFGVMLYEMLTARSPYKGKTPEELIAAAGREEMRAPSEVVRGLSPAIDALYMRCVDRSISRRFPDGSALVAALQALIDPTGPVTQVAPISFDDATDQDGAGNPSSAKSALSTMSVAGVATRSFVDDPHSEEENTAQRPPPVIPRGLAFDTTAPLGPAITDLSLVPIEEPRRRSSAPPPPPTAVTLSHGSIPPPKSGGLRAFHIAGFVLMGAVAFFVARMAVSATPAANATTTTMATTVAAAPAATNATPAAVASNAASPTSPANVDDGALDPAPPIAKSAATTPRGKAHAKATRTTSSPAATAAATAIMFAATATTPPAAPPPPGAAPAPATPASDDCTNPFYVNSEGIRVPKRHCLR